ncbi:MAG TPA: hypothetical protein VK870_09215 [Ignavibacteriaceae bacterium]|nr:hypothetical protein [Ignavibacteriaceae bacterium]
MKKQIAFILLIFLCVFNPNVYSQQQVPPDWIRQYEGIPIKTGLHWDWVLYNQEDVDSMINSGVDILHTHIGVKDDTLIDIGQQMSAIADLNLNVIAVKSRTGSNVLNWIQHYTDAKYSVWEAEGNPNHDANLEYKANVMDEITSGDTLKYLKLKPSAAGLQDTALVYGPFYSQEVKYLTSQDGNLDLVRYTAEYRLKLEINQQYPPIEDNPEDTICVIQVTQSSVGTGPWRLTCTDTIKQRVLKRSDFSQLNQFYEFKLDPNNPLYDYTLETKYCDSAVIGPQHHTFHSRFETTDDFIGRWHRNYIEFKVIWKGNSHYLLSIDKVTLSDIRGRELLGIVPSNAIVNITAQANSLNSYNADELITGWLGIDEPVSIDIFEPIRLVTEILDNTSQRKRPLWITMMGRWDGRWNQRDDPFGAMGLSPWTEMKKRVGQVNIIQNAYMFDAPCSPDTPPEYTACWTGEDYRSINIWRTGELMYKQAYELDPYFGVSIQTGEVHNTVAPAEQRNIHRHEFLYTAHLALMYGAKFLDLAP